jgi:hypothetical protein
MELSVLCEYAYTDTILTGQVCRLDVSLIVYAIGIFLFFYVFFGIWKR